MDGRDREDEDLPPDRWRTIDEIFADALALPPAERETFIAARCGEDRDLAARVHALLATAEAATGFLEGSAVASAPHLRQVLTSAVEDEPLGPGARVGRYRIVGVLGRGGLGTVFLAERDDGHYQREVALKVLRRGLDTDDLIARFRAERQILASLSHPNIAALLDGGATPDGRPFLVMECVDGLPITRYCDTHRLTVEARLRLFLEVSRAVEYAHRNLIVHRDLKPSNILVTPDGTVKLLDFGIAKLLGPTGSGGAPRTRTEVRLLTPEYASPEQVRGGTIGTATDIYQLGLLLYELLTGQHAHRMAGREPAAVTRAVCEEEPRPPSAVLAAEERSGSAARSGSAGRRKARRLRGELDAIVLAALRKEPERRYPSVERMSADVAAHLAGLPVSARADSRLYRARKLVRRHPVGTGAAVILAFLITAHAVLLGAYNQRLAGERDRAALEARKAEQVRDFLVGMFEAADPAVSRGISITVPELLERGAARLSALESEPETHGAILDAMSAVYTSVRLHDQARPVYQRALAVYRETLGPDHPRVADILSELGHVERAVGTLDRARHHYQEAFDIRVRNFGPVHPDVACSLNDLGIIASDAGDHELAFRQYNTALAMRASIVGPDSPCLSAIVNNLAIEYRTVGELDRAVELHREALALRRQALGDHHPRVAHVLNALGITLRRNGAPAEAEWAFREALRINTALGPEHPAVASGFNNIAIVMGEQGDHAQAIALHRTALAMRRHIFGDAHTAVANSLHNLGTALRDAGRPREAAESFAGALALRRELLGEDAPFTVRSQEALAAMGAELGGELPAALAAAGSGAHPSPRPADDDSAHARGGAGSP
jgi:eukaryotic-like serine/threonine-protein kinase